MIPMRRSRAEVTPVVPASPAPNHVQRPYSHCAEAVQCPGPRGCACGAEVRVQLEAAGEVTRS